MKAIKKIIGSDRVLKVFLREKISFNSLMNIVKEKDRSKLELCPDMAFLVGDSPSKDFNFSDKIGLPRPVLGMTLREWPFRSKSRRMGKINRKSYLSSLLETAKGFHERFKGSILVVPQAWGPGPYEDDRPISREFYLRLKGSIPEKNLSLFGAREVPSPYSLIKLFSTLDILIGTRFHSCIFASLAGIPFISLGYQHKSSGTMEMLKLGRFSIDISEISKEKIIPLTEEILNNSEELRSSLRRHIDSIKIEAENILMKYVCPCLR